MITLKVSRLHESYKMVKGPPISVVVSHILACQGMVCNTSTSCVIQRESNLPFSEKVNARRALDSPKAKKEMKIKMCIVRHI